MLQLHPYTINQITAVIIPEIKGAAEDSLHAFAQGARPDGGNNFDNWFIGCACWCSLYKRLDLELTDHPFFTKKTYRRVLTITCPNGDKELTFYVYRVDEERRVPRGGRSIKLQLQPQFFLSDELKDIISRSPKTVYVIGYDISIENGLGKITFDMLSATDKNHFQSDTIFVFEEENIPVSSLHIPQENIETPTVTREGVAHIREESAK